MRLFTEPSTRHYRIVTLAAALFMLLPLPVMQYVGEEGLMALKSYEMFMRDDWLHPSILGGIWPHSPLWHWPVIIISSIIGWEHVDIAVRLVSVGASWLTAWTVGITARWLFAESPQAGWLAALIYLSMGEVAFWYGWLGYLDATFGLFVFAAIAFLWRAVAGESPGYFIVALIMISLAFLTKNITAFALFGLAGLVLFRRYGCWHLLKSPLFLLPGILTLCLPWLWQTHVVPSGANTATTSINDALRNFIGYDLLDYLWHWLSYPLVFAFRALPVNLFVIWLWLTRKQRFRADQRLFTAALILLSCLFPFWISAAATPRYLVPMYGMAALLLTGLTLQMDSRRMRQTLIIITLVVIVKIPYSLGILPYIKDWRPERDVKAVAEEILQLTADAPLYTRNDVATGLAIAAYIDVWRRERPPIRWYSGHETDVYILAEVETPELGQLVQSWRLRGDHVYLYRRAETSDE